jgi:toxin YoeB
MIYEVVTTDTADNHIAKIRKSGDKVAAKRLDRILDELEEHPETGMGKPNRKKYEHAGCWSREITKKHRLLYKIDNEKATVTVYAAYGHYDDK